MQWSKRVRYWIDVDKDPNLDREKGQKKGLDRVEDWGSVDYRQ